ncbi:hypothetical protein MLD38_035188 [Melastoma candidum]|uniref:Uncharacterized protein n=1 Tax=Melastoma candidum TaxID=119954 RepID=A0ACB9MFI0_9MYRT|nr:hypothetical protein MLD38_035188 [Melastoma candidum]
MDGSGDANNHEGSLTGVHQSEDLAGESPREDVNKAAEISPNSSVQNGAFSTSTKSKGMYNRGKCKSLEEQSNSGMIWRINRREKFDNLDDDP